MKKLIKYIGKGLLRLVEIFCQAFLVYYLFIVLGMLLSHFTSVEKICQDWQQAHWIFHFAVPEVSNYCLDVVYEK